MLDTADVLRDGHPVADGSRVERAVLVVRRAVAQVVPAAVDERVHRVGVALGRTAARRARHLDPLAVARQRRLPDRLERVALHVGQDHRQLVVRHRDLAAGGAVDDRDGRAPEALARQQPVAQAVVDRALARRLLLQVGDDPLDRLGLPQPVVRPAVDQHAVARGGGAGLGRVGVAGVDDDADRQVEGPGEVQVALVVRGHRHDGAGAVVGQHVVGREDRHLLAGQRVGRGDAQRDTGLGAVGRLPLDLGQLADLVAVGLERGSLLRRAQLVGQRRVGGDDEERRAVQRVGTCGEDGDRAVAHHEVDVRADGAADPVLLHQQHAVGPGALQRLHVVEQPVGVVGDAEVPLRQLALGDLGSAPLAPALHDLLVGQHGLVLGAPVDRRALAVGQAALQEAQEQPLRPAVVRRVAGVQPTAPVEAHRVAPEGVGLRVDVGVGPRGRVLTALDGGVLGGQPEGVPSDRVQHVVAAAHPVARDHVADAERLRVTHVQVAARVREHVQHVLLRRPLPHSRAVEVEAVPHRQPAVLDGVRVVADLVSHAGSFQRVDQGPDRRKPSLVTRAPR